MSCNKLKPPSPPSLETLPDNIKAPIGGSLDNIKSQASGKGLSDAMSNVGELVGDNIKSMAESMGPGAIVDKVGEFVSGIVDTIGDTINSVVDGVAGLKGQLKSLNPGAKLSPADKLKDAVSNKSGGIDEMKQLASKVSKDGCDKKYISQAGEVNKNMTGAAGAAAAGISRKDRAKMAKDPEFNKQIKEKVAEDVKIKTAEDIKSKATTPDKENINLQEKTQSVEIEPVKRTPPPPSILFADSFITDFLPGWSGNTGMWPKFEEYIMSPLEEFILRLQTGENKRLPDEESYTNGGPLNPEYSPSPNQYLSTDATSWSAANNSIHSKFEYRNLWTKAMGKGDNPNWDRDDAYVDKTYYMMYIKSQTMSNEYFLGNGSPVVLVKTIVYMTHTAPIADGHILGNYNVTTVVTSEQRALEDTAADAYTTAVKSSIDNMTSRLIQLIN
jgi:hypothetical protein